MHDCKFSYQTLKCQGTKIGIDKYMQHAVDKNNNLETLSY